MALFALKALPSPGGKSAQCNALIYFHIVSNLGCFAYYYTGTVIDEKMVADYSSRVDIYAGYAMGIFCHNSGNHGNSQRKKLMGQAIHTYGKYAGIGKNYFVPVAGGGIAVKSRIHVC